MRVSCSSRSWMRWASSRSQPGDCGQAVVVDPDPERRAGLDQLGRLERAQPGPQLVGCGGHDGAQLVGRLGAGLGGAALHDLQQSQRLDRAVVGLRGRGGLTGQHCPRGGDRVDHVGLAVLPTDLPVRTRHLDHLETGGGQDTSQRGSIAAGALSRWVSTPPVTKPGSGVIVVMSALLVAGQGRARRDRRRTGQGRARCSRLLLGHSVEARANWTPAQPTNRLKGSLTTPVIIGVRPGGSTAGIQHPCHYRGGRQGATAPPVVSHAGRLNRGRNGSRQHLGDGEPSACISR